MSNKKIIKENLKHFIEPHPDFTGTEEEIFTPVKRYTIKFWVEGGLEISGDHGTMEINYNSGDLLVLAVRGQPMERIIRIPWKRVVAFELLVKKNSGFNTANLIYLTPESRN